MIGDEVFGDEGVDASLGGSTKSLALELGPAGITVNTHSARLRRQVIGVNGGRST
ncbi:hypothetical protein [Streptomyces pseudovenezuelae]|uniref:NAD(P)-dependent dehydrogenase (Short-subunit alcohol dehydrogenase family) n=1 Tax=Streptomyces pseudovenezuelae TaxID=67350 RepID=A0ABT6LBL1_9ACTN|nr:hypothetical protein [Streptomyces pseudovenezuelae]MDH6213692.1 NAD(P)-dependent dehydrogenase (short-subunit alcohol dehydrogenase family) [Streptomyces pseudovenezuelae]